MLPSCHSTPEKHPLTFTHQNIVALAEWRNDACLLG
jgi:hypothetical protein